MDEHLGPRTHPFCTGLIQRQDQNVFGFSSLTRPILLFEAYWDCLPHPVEYWYSLLAVDVSGTAQVLRLTRPEPSQIERHCTPFILLTQTQPLLEMIYQYYLRWSVSCNDSSHTSHQSQVWPNRELGSVLSVSCTFQMRLAHKYEKTHKLFSSQLIERILQYKHSFYQWCRT